MASTSSSSLSSPAGGSATPLHVTPTVEQQRLLDRIAVQRERLRARRAARAQALAQSRQGGEVGSGVDASLALRAAAFAREHPAAVAVLAGAALMAGPRRLIRWAGVVLPIVLRMRRP